MGKRIQMTKNDGVKTLKELYDDFEKTCRIRNLSSETIKYYQNCYHILCNYKSEIYLDEINNDFVKDYILYLQQTMKPVSVNCQLRGLRSICNHAFDLGLMPKLIIKQLKCDKEVRETYTEEQIKKLIKKPNLKKCDFVEYRNWVIVSWFVATGNRIGTVLEIKIKDVDLANQLVVLRHNKNRNQNIIPLCTSICKILSEYLQYRKGEDDDYLFCAIDGSRLSKRSLQCSIQKYNRDRGVVSITSCHAFRRYFAKQCVLNGVDIFTLQKLGNWKSLDVVKNYINIYATDIKNYDSFNPLQTLYSDNNRLNMIK